jgi:hypothetical protein
LAGKTEVLGENLPQWTLFTINPTWPDPESSPGHRGRKPATNRLSYGAANHTATVVYNAKAAREEKDIFYVTNEIIHPLVQ